MLNEPNPEPVPGDGGGAGGAGGMADDTPGGSHMRYIQVTPQEKEAIERVRRSTALSLTFSLSPKFRKCWNVKHNSADVALILTLVVIFLRLVNMKHRLTFASLSIVWLICNSSLFAAKSLRISRGTCYTSLLCVWEERELGCQLPFTTELWWWLKESSSLWPSFFLFFFFLFLPPLFDCWHWIYVSSNTFTFPKKFYFHIHIS